MDDEYSYVPLDILVMIKKGELQSSYCNRIEEWEQNNM